MTDVDSLLRWPLDTDGWQHTLLLGTLLVATLPLVVPGVLLAGYAVRLLRTEPGDPTLPTFADLRLLAGTGLRAAGIVVAYHLPAAALLAAGTAGVASAFHQWRTLLLLRPGSIVGAFDLARLTGSVGLALLGMALLPVCGYVATVAVTAYADADDVAAAFTFGPLRERVCAVATLRAWLLASLVVVASGVCAALLGGASATIPGVGAFLTGAVGFYGALVAVGVWNAARPADDATGDGSRTMTAEASADPM
jgi:hypothetical protein